MIEEERKVMNGIEKSIAVEEEKVKSSETPHANEKNISTILDAWDIMNYAERRAVILEWINSVTVYEGRISIDFKF